MQTRRLRPGEGKAFEDAWGIFQISGCRLVLPQNFEPRPFGIFVCSGDYAIAPTDAKSLLPAGIGFLYDESLATQDFRKIFKQPTVQTYPKIGRPYGYSHLAQYVSILGQRGGGWNFAVYPSLAEIQRSPLFRREEPLPAVAYSTVKRLGLLRFCH